MKIHQQRVPIISPLDRDYHRRSSAPDGLGSSISSFSSFKDVASKVMTSNLAKEGYQTGNSELSPQNSDKDILLFTIVGERDL